MKKLNSKFFQRGQALLVTIMILATVITVILATTFTSRTDTQVTKLEEESQKALAAAEAGIEKALELGLSSGSSIPIESISHELANAGFSGTVTVNSSDDRASFTSPLIKKDDQYTYYLTTYNKSTGVFGTSTAQAVTVCFGSGGSPNPAIEISLIKSNYSIKRYVVDPDGRIPGASPAGSSCGVSGFAYSYTVPAIDISSDSLILIVRMLFNDSTVAVDASGDLPSQGLSISSTAKSSAGATKIIRLFQSLPQIPADFFVTQFDDF